MAIMVSLTSVALLAAFALMVFLYVRFAPAATCARNIALITMTLIICVALLALTICAVHLQTEAQYDVNVFTATAVCAYLFWLCATALGSAPSDGCAPAADDSKWYSVRRCNAATGWYCDSKLRGCVFALWWDW